MKSKKHLGIWMDYSSADLIDPGHKKARTIESEFSPVVKEEALKKGEKHMHHKEQQLQEAYFKAIADQAAGYDQVLLFGPTNAKSEFHHYLENEERFKQVKMALQSTDKMTENEKNAFVKKHFNL